MRPFDYNANVKSNKKETKSNMLEKDLFNKSGASFQPSWVVSV